MGIVKCSKFYYYSYKTMAKIITIFSLLFFALLLFSTSVKAELTYDLIAPTGTLKRGDTARFQVNIDTDDQTITSSSVGMTYDTNYIDFKSITAGNAMTSVSKTDTETGKFLMNGSNNAGFKGFGVFAYVDFQITADAPGSTELCSLWGPTPTTPPPNPTSPPNATSPPNPTSPQPTELPRAGSSTQADLFAVVGFSLFFLAVGTRLFANAFLFKQKPHESRKHV